MKGRREQVVVARTNFMAATTQRRVRVVGLSTALANAGDLADWLAIPDAGLFNFRPSVRPVPTVVHISGYSGKHYCPRMASMNKPAFNAIRQHSPDKVCPVTSMTSDNSIYFDLAFQPVLIFVSSRRQTRMTAQDLLALLFAEGEPGKWLHMEQDEVS